MSSHMDQAASISGNPVATAPAFDAAPATTRPAPGIRARVMAAVRASSVPQRFLAVLLVMFLFKGIIISLVFPPFTGHDEVAHYTYTRILTEEGRVPVIPEPNVWREKHNRIGESEEEPHDKLPAELWEYCRYTTADWVGCGDPRCREPCYAAVIPPDWQTIPSGWVYTANHPPLFYLFMAPLYKLTSEQTPEFQQYVFRLAAIPFGMLTVVFAYLTVRAIFPRDRFLAMTVPAFVAFQPQISYEAAMLNNDILAIMFSSAVIWLIAVGLRKRFPLWACLLIGVFFGLAMLSKSTSVAFGALIAFGMIFGLGIKNIREWAPKGAVAAATAGLLVWPWIAYMWWTYGDLTALNRVEALQWWNYSGGDGRSIPDMLTDRWFHWDRWKETWGAFGWRLIQLDAWGDATLLRVLLWITLGATVGLAFYSLRFLREQRAITRAELEGEDAGALRYRSDETLAIMPWQVVALLTMGAACVLGYYSILQFGTTFSLTQARYYFPMIVPAAILFMLGVRSWFPRRWLRYAGAATFLGLVLLNVIIYTAHVIPYWNQGM